MKMTTKIIPVLLTVISAVTFANTNDSIKRDVLLRVVADSANGSYKLIYQAEQNRVKFMLLNEEGNILHDEHLRIENDNETLTEVISYSSLENGLADKIQFDRVADQLELIGSDLRANLNIFIYDDKNELVYSGEINADNVDRIFDFGRIKSNWVSFVILSDKI